MEFKKDNDDYEWHRDDFDFDAFLNDDLDDRVTAAVDGRDLLDPDTLGVSADYIPRRAGEGERGRHEAPGEEGGEWEFDPDDPRYAAPERPRVVVAEPRRSVYVTPPGGETPTEDDRRSSGGGGREPLKWVAVVLGAIVVIGVILLITAVNRSGRSTDEPRGTVSGTVTPAPTQTSSPTDTPEPTQPPKGSYMITVTAGSGGSVTPSGIVTAEEGADSSFTIRANDGYVLSQLLVDGEPVSPAEQYTFRGVTKNHTLYAVFESTATPTPEPTPTPAPTAGPTPTPEPTPTPTAPPTPIPEEDPGQQDWDEGGEPIPGNEDES